MTWLFAIMVVLAMAGIAAVAAGRGGSMPPAHDDRPDLRLPGDRPLGPADLRTVRFPLALRGYRMSDVDDLLARLATELEDRAEASDQRGDEGGDEDRDASGEAGPA